jgi:hypothetical protein
VLRPNVLRLESYRAKIHGIWERAIMTIPWDVSFVSSPRDGKKPITLEITLATRKKCGIIQNASLHRDRLFIKLVTVRRRPEIAISQDPFYRVDVGLAPRFWITLSWGPRRHGRRRNTADKEFEGEGRM